MPPDDAGAEIAVSTGPRADALVPLRARLSRTVREREVLRVTGTIASEEQEAAVEEACNAVLAWAQRRCGGDLPERAWQGESFEYIAAGRNTLGVRLATEDSGLWALRGDDPDKEVAGRVWTTEVVKCALRRRHVHVRLPGPASRGRLAHQERRQHPRSPALPAHLLSLGRRDATDRRRRDAGPWPHRGKLIDGRPIGRNARAAPGARRGP
jgi:hypothetical protein